MLKEIFNKSYQEYNDHIFKNIPEYWDHLGYQHRRWQIEALIGALNDNFSFEKLMTIETGASQSYKDGVFGLFLGFVTEKTGGKMIAVDIDRNIVDRSQELFKTVAPNLDYKVFEDDSIKFLTNLIEIPNFVHLDSLDLDLTNPLPSALQGWREFEAIESKMPSGSIILIDDNFPQGTWIDWNYPDGRQERITITYPMVGKGANVYQYVLNGNSNWNLIGDQYNICTNIKIMIQKK
jgi:hypothetical protein